MMTEQARLRCVYVIADKFDRVKIGISHDPQTRIAGISRVSGLEIMQSFISDPVPRADIIEKRLHEYFSYARIRGEWFDVDFESVVYKCEEVGLVMATSYTDGVLIRRTGYYWFQDIHARFSPNIDPQVIHITVYGPTNISVEMPDIGKSLDEFPVHPDDFLRFIDFPEGVIAVTEKQRIAATVKHLAKVLESSIELPDLRMEGRT